MTPPAMEHTGRLDSVDTCIGDEEGNVGVEKTSPARGIGEDWTGPDDPECPKNWSLRKKIYTCSGPTMYCFVATYASSTYTSGDAEIQARFGVGKIVTLLGFSLFAWGLALGPAIGGPISENYGRRVVYLSTFPIFALFTLGAGFAQNLPTLAICRFFAGVFGSPALSVCGGTVADMWPNWMIGRVWAIFCLAPLIGPSIGPVIGGFVVDKLNFRWTEWVVLFFLCATYLWSLPMQETYKPAILRVRRKRLGIAENTKPTTKGVAASAGYWVKMALGKPLSLIVHDPIVLALSVYVAFSFGVNYSLYASFPYVFKTAYGFGVTQVGLSFLGTAVGVVLGVAAGVVIDIKTYGKLGKHLSGKREPSHDLAPEQRLIAACFGSFLNPVSLFWFGWTADKQVHWICPIIASVLFGMGNFMIFISVTIYLLDAYRSAAGASAMGACSLLRYAASGAFPLFITQMYKALGIGWASSLLGFVSLALAPIPFVFIKWGPYLRARSKYAPS